MRKEDYSLAAVIAEAVGILMMAAYVVIQIYYGIFYKIAVYKFVCNIVGVVLVYALLWILCSMPEKIHRFSPEACVGDIRKYTIRMLRIIKLVFVAGLLVPCVADAMGVELQEAYSIFVMAAILLITLYYEIKIIRVLRDDQDHHSK
jgi:L-asparagine transporter-like permease